ncbi:O-glucosyltransferase rumi-like isoform X2 [Benincasa hispida]|uniref:O-glucosyltransferase rumi-like isoform X2 n=1 Tax=Benincasa hispida TaxID=102211 RepID=UPI0019012025|nr:O-glucosyltransferase rumi-like isoform X2 [Benincasa hispida]
MKRCTDKNLHQIFCYDSSSSSIQPPTWRWRWRSSRTKPSFKTIASFLFFFLFFLLGLFIRLDWIKAPIYWRVKGVENNRSISDGSTNATCPPHFRWIHEDLRPWRETGITREMVERARKMAHFRVVIVDGRVYVEKYKRSIQTRDLFTMWGLLQLVRWYPGRLPDLELMFDCDDRPVVRSNDFLDPKSGPPPLFRYCSDESSLDIVFPDWSFWGWGEINIKPWRMVLEDIKEGNKRTKWKDRVPFAYWKGNPYVDPSRKDLLKCNLTQQHNWDTLLYVQAQAIGEEGSKYLQENLKMELVYDYMFHLLNEYSKLLKFRPSVPSGAMELKPETMTGATVGLHKKFLEDSLEKSPSDTEPCDLPPHDPTVLNEFREKKLNALKQVEIWENEYWENQRKGN